MLHSVFRCLAMDACLPLSACAFDGVDAAHPLRCDSAGKLILNAGMLAYSAAIVPVQLSFWEQIDICTAQPTLYFDVFVDSFFLVSLF